jgi:copper transport protein
VQVAEPTALLTTAYGLVLCAKLSLVAVLLSVAAWNRFRLTEAVIAGATKPRRELARLIGIEIAIVVAVLGLVAAWRFTPPPRALVIASAKPALVHIHTAAAMANVTFEPARAGMVQASIVIMRGDFGGLDAREVRLTLDNKTADIEAISRPATKGSDNIWRIPQLPIPTGGRWNIHVEILINDFEKVTLEDHVDIRNR